MNHFSKIKKYGFFTWLRQIIFFKSMKWFCTKDLDQWDRWSFDTKYGKVFVQISRESDGWEYTHLEL